MKRAHKKLTYNRMNKVRVPYDTLTNKKFNRMKYLYLILLGLLALVPAVYAEGNGNANQISMTQTNNISVKGKVVDEKGESLPGVTVAVKGTTSGTITDVDGNYMLGNLPEDAVLVFSFVGMETQEITVDRPVINVQLKATTIGLNEVVAIGLRYATQG